jgi:hypothetical protein
MFAKKKPDGVFIPSQDAFAYAIAIRQAIAIIDSEFAEEPRTYTVPLPLDQLNDLRKLLESAPDDKEPIG